MTLVAVVVGGVWDETPLWSFPLKEIRPEELILPRLSSTPGGLKDTR